jgi:Flp pilus assembly secretin CpaC
VIECTSQGFIGAIAATVANPAIASVELAAGTESFFYVTGLQAGSTTASFLTQSGGAGQITITVVPNVRKPQPLTHRH